MTEAELDEFAANFSGLKDVGRVVSALRIAWAERDALKAEVERLRMRCSDLKLALGDSAGWFDRFTSMQAERDARPDAATVAKVWEALVFCRDGLSLDTMEKKAREALRLLEGKP